MQFKDFEIRPARNITEKVVEGKYELVKWQNNTANGRSCFVLAFLEWDKKDRCFDFRGVGLRYQEHYESGLNEYVLKYAELLTVIERQRTEKEGE